MTRRFEIQAEYPHPVALVWRALTQPEWMGLWIMNFDQTPGEMRTDFRPVVGAKYRMDAPPKGWRGYVVGEVIEVVPEERLVITWAHGAYQDAHPARIEFTLSPTATGTRLRMAQSGFPGVKGWFVRIGARLGWKRMLDPGLRTVLARQAGR